MLNRYICVETLWAALFSPIIRFTDHAYTSMIQICYLEQWPALEEECNGTLVEATEALKASTLRLPVTSGAQVCAKQTSSN
jgi:hypothetical protein